MGINIKRNNELVHKVAATLQAKKMSPFEFYCTLDVNSSGRVSKIELKTGMQALGASINTQDFNDLWKTIKKPTKKIGQKKL
jgi:Ca2+-binding EF-hand superfamily protein